MAASVVKIATIVQKTRNADQVGADIIQECHRITYTADATVEVPTSLSNIFFVTGGVSGDVSAPAANILGCDRIITSGAVTVGATANNSDTFDVMFFGTSK